MRSGPSAARRRRPLPALLFDAAAVLAVGAVIVGAALVPALTASTEPATTVDGDVRVGGAPVPGMDIGFWSPTEGVLATASTDAVGNFVLPVPTGSDGYLYAGTRPDSVEAIARVGTRSLIRGVVGAVVPHGITSPLYQGFAAATARNIAGGSAVHFALQQPGRIAGTSRQLTHPGLRLELQRLDGSVVQVIKADRKGRFTTRPVVPGDYRMQVVPKPPLVPATLAVRVAPGRTAAVTLPAPQRGATVSGVLTAEGEAVDRGVPVLLLLDGNQIRRTTTGDGGAYRFTGLAAGTYQVVFGRSVATAGAASATAGAAADEVRPAAAIVRVASSLTDVVQDAELVPAGLISGTVPGLDGVPASVLAEDPTSHAVLRTATVAVDGTFRLGGLTAGQAYDLVAVTSPSDAAATRWGTATATATTATVTTTDQPAIEVATPGLTLSGTVSGATTGSVTVGDPTLFTRVGTIGADGGYVVNGLVPGAFVATVQEPERVPSDPTAVTVTGGAASQDLPRAAQPATYKAWFISAGAGVPRITGAAVDAAGHLVRFGPSTDAGHVTIGSLAPGTYRYRETTFVGSIAADDGPWWFGPPTGTFTLRAGATTDVGPVVLHIHAH